MQRRNRRVWIFVALVACLLGGLILWPVVWFAFNYGVKFDFPAALPLPQGTTAVLSADGADDALRFLLDNGLGHGLDGPLGLADSAQWATGASDPTAAPSFADNWNMALSTMALLEYLGGADSASPETAQVPRPLPSPARRCTLPAVYLLSASRRQTGTRVAFEARRRAPRASQETQPQRAAFRGAATPASFVVGGLGRCGRHDSAGLGGMCPSPPPTACHGAGPHPRGERGG